MKITTKIVLLGMQLLAIVPNVVAQSHTNSWFRTTLSIPVTEKVKTDIEFQHRRQNDFESHSPFDKNLMYTFRTWLYYKPNNDVVYAISPFAYFSNYKIIQKENDADAKPTNEYRFSVSVEWQHELVTKFFIVDRTAFEYRLFEGATKDVIRLRNRLAFRYDYNSKLNVSIGDEALINTTGTDSQHLFDHNRLFTNFSFKPSPALKLDTGYIYISRLSRSTIDLIEESNFYLNFTYTLPMKRHI